MLPSRPPATAVASGIDWAAARATAEAFDGCCLVRRGDLLLASLAAGDPLHDSLGTHAGPLLGIRSRQVDPSLAARDMAELLIREKPNLWLARVDQVAAVAASCGAPLPRLDGTLSGVVMPIADVAELPRATAAAAAFLEAFGVEPVTAFVPREAGGLVAMNSPPARAAADHEITLKRGTVGRVVNGVVVWPRAEVRDRLGRPPLPCGSNETAGAATLAIGATFPLPRTAADADGRQPAAVLLAAAFDVDADGFLVLREGGSS